MRKILAALAFTAVSIPCRSADPEPPAFRLGDVAAPTAYDLRLEIDPRETHFAGEVRIELKLARAAKVFWLHARGLEVDSASVSQGDRPITVRVVKSARGFVGLEAEGGFLAGDAIAELHYRGTLEVIATRGLFRQKEGGDWYVLSQFESISARRAFPCFDEPGFKTPWRLTVDAPSTERVVSNTPEVLAFDLPERSGWRRHAFAQTRPLPTYLVALGVGPFDIVEGGTAGGQATPLAYVAPRGRGDETRYAQQSTPRELALLEAYFGSAFPFSKLDTVAIPATVGFGAMENAGMITYGSDLLLATPREESAAFRRRYASVAAHEMAHQWFGDLVTLAWWDDTWLNEAFATWMARKTLREYRPEFDHGWRRGDSRRRALNADRLAAARQVRNPVARDNDIYAAFDGITYSKGAEVIAMFETRLGDEAFRRGVREFLAAHAWGNATAEDFFAAVGAVSAHPLETVAALRGFVEQPGAPLVDMELDCDGERAALRVSQRRLVPMGTQAAPMQWTTPACFRYRAGGALHEQCEDVGNAPRTIVLKDAGTCPAWVVGNAGGAGHWVARYGANQLRALPAVVADLPEEEAIALAGDSALLANTGLLPRADAMAIVAALLRHPALGPRHGAIAFLAAQREDWLDPPQRRELGELIAREVQPMARQVGWIERPGEDLQVQDLRGELLPFAARSEGGEALRAEARRLALAWLDDRAAVPASGLPAVLDTAARFADTATYERLERALREATHRRERSELGKALAKVRDRALRARAWSLLLEPAVDGREAFQFLEESLQDDHNRADAFAWMRSQWAAFAARIPPDSASRLMSPLGSLCAAPQRALFADFFGARAQEFEGGPRRYAQALESIDICRAVHPQS